MTIRVPERTRVPGAPLWYRPHSDETGGVDDE
jgi:hypothetical protein